MAKNTQPIAKRCKALGISPAVMGYAKKNTTRNSNGNFRKKKSEYATQMQEKQKLKFIYGVLEKQFSNYFEEASRRQGQAGENLLQLLECRLDNVVFRLGYASTRRDARQLVSHNHFTVNGKRVNIPSYQVKAGDVMVIIDQAEYKARLDAAKAAVAQAEASFNNSSVYYQRMQKAGARAVSKTELDNAKASFLSAEAALEQAKAALAEAQVNYDYTVIRATIDGVVGDVPLSNPEVVAFIGSFIRENTQEITAQAQ